MGAIENADCQKNFFDKLNAPDRKNGQGRGKRGTTLLFVQRSLAAHLKAFAKAVTDNEVNRSTLPICSDGKLRSQYHTEPPPTCTNRQLSTGRHSVRFSPSSLLITDIIPILRRIRTFVKEKFWKQSRDYAADPFADFWEICCKRRECVIR